MIAGIIDSSERKGYWKKALGGSFQCSVTADPNWLPDCDILLVSQEYCGGALDSVLEKIRSSDRLGRLPAAALTTDFSVENQEILLSLGFDDIIRLPVCDKLLLRRAMALTALPDRRVIGRSASIESLMSSNDADSGAYCVRSVEFGNILRFVTRVLERTGKGAQVLVMNLSCRDGCSTDQRSKVMNTLAGAVKLCLRRGDMASVYGDDQVVVLLIGADDNGGHLVASRIVSSFYSECDDRDFELSYDIREVRAHGA